MVKYRFNAVPSKVAVSVDLPIEPPRWTKTMMRFTVIGRDAIVSFSGPGHLLKMITAVLANGATDVRLMLDGLAKLDEAATQRIRGELAVFDEHCLEGDDAAVRAWFAGSPERLHAAFRVVDPMTRALSTKALRLGVVLFNLGERRIVQVQNSFGGLRRQDRGRIRRHGKPAGRFYVYRLPEEWSIVP